MGDIVLVEGSNKLDIVLEPIPVIPLGRIGKWSYSVTVAYPTVHREYGEWLNHTLNFEYDLHPSTFFIQVLCYNDSTSPATAKLEIVNTNATILNQAGIQYILPGKTPFNFSMGLPRVPREYYFDAVLSFDGVTVDEGRWIINYS